MLRGMYAAMAVGGSLALGLAGCSQAPADPRSLPTLVQVSTVGTGPSATELSFSGIVSARVQSGLGFRVPGKVTERLVDAGRAVKRGDALMRIDRNDLELSEAAQAGLVAAARARAEQTAADEARYRDLVSAGAVSASAYDQAKAAAISAKNQLAAAVAQQGVTSNQAGYSTLRADSDGVVMETLAEPGAVVAAGQVVIRLAHAGPREATVYLPEGLRPSIGDTAKATLYSPPLSGSAKLRQLSNSADPLTRTYDARYVLEGQAANAPLGATVAIRLVDAGKASDTTVRLGAIYDGGSGPGVWIVSGQEPVVTWRPVKIAGLGDETATLSEGLHAGEKFVSLGAQLLHPGEHVRIAPAQVAAR